MKTIALTHQEYINFIKVCKAAFTFKIKNLLILVTADEKHLVELGY